MLGGDRMVLPAPDYDSGWIQTPLILPPAGPPPHPVILNHNLGTTDLLVQIVIRIGHNAPPFVNSSKNTWVLNASEITVTVLDGGMEFRVRIWKIPPPTIPISGW